MIEKYLDKEGRVFVLPKKKDAREAVYEYLIEKFEIDKAYTEKEVNDIISKNHSFNDTCLLRRELIEYKLLSRNDNGTCYQREFLK